MLRSTSGYALKPLIKLRILAPCDFECHTCVYISINANEYEYNIYMLCLKTAPQLFGVQHAPLTLFLLCSLVVAMAAFVKSQCKYECPPPRNLS